MHPTGDPFPSRYGAIRGTCACKSLCARVHSSDGHSRCAPLPPSEPNPHKVRVFENVFVVLEKRKRTTRRELPFPRTAISSVEELLRFVGFSGLSEASVQNLSVRRYIFIFFEEAPSVAHRSDSKGTSPFAKREFPILHHPFSINLRNLSLS